MHNNFISVSDALLKQLLRKGLVVALLSFALFFALSIVSLASEQSVSGDDLILVAIALSNYNGTLLGINYELKKSGSLMGMKFTTKYFCIFALYFQAIFISIAVFGYAAHTA
jgi:hypothetical protein